MIRIPTALLIITIMAGVAFRFAHHRDVFSRSPDERVYSYFAARVAEQGYRALPQVFKEYAQGGEIWKYPAPTRLGTVLAFTVPLVLFDDGTAWKPGNMELAAACMSLLASIGSLLLVAWIGLRFFDEWVAVLATWFMACNFTELGLSRRAWSDGIAGLCGLVIIWLACEIAEYEVPHSLFLRRLRKSNLIRWYAAFFVACTVGVLAKESVGLSCAACGLVLLALAAWDGEWLEVLWIVAGSVVSAAGAALVLAMAAGGVRPALAILPPLPRWFQQLDPNGYLSQCCAGTWWHFPAVLATTAPLVAILVILGVSVAMIGPRWRLGAVLAAVVAVYLGVASFGPAFQYMRFISPSDGAYCLLAAIGGFWVARTVHAGLGMFGKPAMIILALLVLFYGVMEYRAYVQIVVRTGMEDLAVNGIRTVQSSLQ